MRGLDRYGARRASPWILILATVPACFAQDRTGPLDLTDLPALRAALEDRPVSVPPVIASFHDLWDDPKAFMGRPVIVEGRVVRLFHQGPVGEFPAMVEIWLATPAGDVLCATCPEHTPTDPNDTPIPKIGQQVEFIGTCFRKIAYSARDGSRLAPLVVGSRAPRVFQDHPPDLATDDSSRFPSVWTSRGFWVVLMISVVACLAAWWRQKAAWSSRKFGIRRDIEPDPPIEFVEGRGDAGQTEA